MITIPLANGRIRDSYTDMGAWHRSEYRLVKLDNELRQELWQTFRGSEIFSATVALQRRHAHYDQDGIMTNQSWGDSSRWDWMGFYRTAVDAAMSGDGDYKGGESLHPLHAYAVAWMDRHAALSKRLAELQTDITPSGRFRGAISPFQDRWQSKFDNALREKRLYKKASENKLSEKELAIADKLKADIKAEAMQELDGIKAEIAQIKADLETMEKHLDAPRVAEFGPASDEEYTTYGIEYA